MKKKICISLMAAFAVLLTVSAYFLIGGKVDDNTQAEKYESIAEIVAQPDETAEPVQLTEDKTLLPDYSELYFQNTDMVGWISIQDTNINYPVMQSVDEPNFYLKHGFDKTYSDYGCPFINVDEKSYMPVNGFTTVDLGCERGNNVYNFVQKTDAPVSGTYLELFESIWNDKVKMQDVTDEVIDNITTAYNENSPDFIYFVTLYNIFNEFLEDVSEDVLPNEATGFKESKIWNMLYNFQKDIQSK
jgi:hypothetical protein